MTPTKKKTFWEEVLVIGKTVAVSIALLSIIGTAIWQLSAKGLVDTEVKAGVMKLEFVVMPKINMNSEAIKQIKENQLLTYFSVKQLLSVKQKEDAERELEEIKRRQ